MVLELVHTTICDELHSHLRLMEARETPHSFEVVRLPELSRAQVRTFTLA